MRNTSPRLLDKLRKDIVATFKNEGLNITIETNMKCVNFLDVTMNLETGKFHPYRKPNDQPLYINVNSNHPAQIKKELPQMISKRVSDLSYDEEEFKKHKETYNKALKDAAFTEKIKYSRQENRTGQRKNRKRNVIWFNPPFNSNVETNVGKHFLKLLKTHFPRHHKLSKIFNLSTIKLSYSCMPNVAQIIKGHNAKLLRNEPQQSECNCNNQDNCPLDGQCRIKCIVYKATVTSTDGEKIYFGTSDPEFKKRERNHRKAFRNRQYENDSELSKYIWKIKDDNLNYTVKWDIEKRCSPYRSGSRKCDLCAKEKVCIARCNHPGLLNKRSELISKCRHRNKFSLKNVRY